MELRPLVKYSGCLQEVESGGKLLDRQSPKVVAVAYRSKSFTRSSIRKASTGKSLVFWIGGRLYTRGSRTWRFNGSKRVSDAVNSLNYFSLFL